MLYPIMDLVPAEDFEIVDYEVLENYMAVLEEKEESTRMRIISLLNPKKQTLHFFDQTDELSYSDN